MKCNFCNSEMEFREKSDISIPIGNPKKVKLKADFYKCSDCGKELLKPNESLRIAKIVDDINDKLERGEEMDMIEIGDGEISF